MNARGCRATSMRPPMRRSKSAGCRSKIQDGASNGYYQRAALDGSRPAIYFINLKDAGDWPKYSLPSLTYHEGVPGPSPPALDGAGLRRHADAAQGRASSRPMARAGRSTPSISPTSWAPTTRSAGPRRLSAILSVPRRAPGGRHRHPRQAVEPRAGDRLYGQATGFARPRSQREVERYCTMPGQACSYKVGHAAWTRAREKARRRRWAPSSGHQVVPRHPAGWRHAADHHGKAHRGADGGEAEGELDACHSREAAGLPATICCAADPPSAE